MTVREIAAQFGVGKLAVQEMMEILGYRKVYSCWVSRLLTSDIVDNSKERLRTALPSTLQSGFVHLSLPLIRALERSPARSLLWDWRDSPGSRTKLIARSWNGLLPQR
jgi:hypothetical protein